jgi:predicted alpha/beta superfamily hydrolase
VVSADQLQQACSAALTAGLPVTFLQYPDCGHSSVIAQALPDIVKWLLQQKLAGPNK